MTAPAISVVTPFYNTAAYLAECIESVLRQTRRDFEYLLVNNCSTDGSREIAAAYAARDPRIRLVDQPSFLGQIENYNAALRAIAPGSRFCKIVQADDWIFPRCLEEMAAVGESDPAVAIVGSFHYFGDRLQFTNMPLDVRVHEGRDLCRRQLLEHQYLLGNPTTLLYAADCVRERVPFFEPGRYADDREACFDVLRRRRFGFVPQVLSYVRLRADSIMGAHAHDDSIAASLYTTVRRFGPAYLAEPELRALEAEVARNYRLKLGLAALLLRERSYWNHQRMHLAESGATLRRSWVASGAARVALHGLLHPRWAVGTLRWERRRRSGRPVDPAPVWGLA